MTGLDVTPLTARMPGAVVEDGFGMTTVEVPAEAWVETVAVARETLGCTFFDFLTAVDEPDGFHLVCHVAAPAPFRHLLLRTRLTHDAPTVASISAVFAGAAWHERETAEMFGVTFLDAAGTPLELPGLLLRRGFEGHPLRKDFELSARLERPWPGAKEGGS